MLEMRSNKVWDEEAAGLPRLVENSDEMKLDKKNSNETEAEIKLDKKTDGDAGSLAGAEAVQAATDERRRKEVTKSEIENKYRLCSFGVGGDCIVEW